MASASDSDHAMGRISPQVYLSGRVSPSNNGVLTKANVLDAIARSTDDGCTLDLSNKNLVDIGEVGAEELAQVGRGEDLLDECRILRIALVGNFLSSLPMSFARITRLRYLTLRSNNFTVIPEVLTTMPSLEILDLSRNKIRGLPTNPGTLVNLRVISLSRNKIRKLPTYLWKFKNLTVVKADHNPIEWPPREIMEPDEDLEDQEAMHNWVESLKTWIAENSAGEERYIATPAEMHTELGQVVASTKDHSRTESVDSERSIYSTSSYDAPIKESKPDSLSTIDMNIVSPSITEDISASPESYLPPREDSLPSIDNATAAPVHTVHGRNRSYAPGESRSRGLSVQKSLPDLRITSRQIPIGSRTRLRAPSVDDLNKTSSENVSSMRDSPFQGPQSHLRPRPQRQPPHEPLPSISEQRKAPSLDFERNSYFRRFSCLPVATISKMTPSALLSVIDCVRGILFAVSQVYQSLQHYTVYCIDERLSAVLNKVLDPASTCLMQLINALDKFDSMSKRACPPPHVCRNVLESCRDNVEMFGKAVGVLAMQLRVFSTREDVRYSRQMLLVLHGSMAEISNSWQGIVPQLEPIEPLLRDDQPSPPPSSVTTITPVPPKAFRAHLTSQTSSSRGQIPPIAEQPEPPFVNSQSTTRPVSPIARTHSAQTESLSLSTAPAMRRPVQSEGRARTSRRHAGSFSVKDIEIGRSLPSNIELSPQSAEFPSGSSTPTPRVHATALRSNTSIGSSVPPLSFSNPATLSQTQPSPGLHSRQNSGQSAVVNTPQPSILSTSKGLPDVPTNTGALVDKEALDAMEIAVKAAPAVWSTLEEIKNDPTSMPFDIKGTLAKAQSVTRRLGDNIKAVQEGHLNADRKSLREDAHVFIKTVIVLSKVVKDYSAAHRLSGQLRSDMAKLTNATQQFVILLHVSSFAPSTPRPYSPSVNVAQNPNSTGVNSSGNLQSPAIGGLPIPESEERPLQSSLGAGLGRSRSAQPAASSKLVPSGSSSPTPRSAQPHQQSFKVPGTPRANGTSKLRNGDLAPSVDIGHPADSQIHVNG